MLKFLTLAWLVSAIKEKTKATANKMPITNKIFLEKFFISLFIKNII